MKHYAVIQRENSRPTKVLELGIDSTVEAEKAVERHKKAEVNVSVRDSIEYVSHDEFVHLFQETQDGERCVVLVMVEGGMIKKVVSDAPEKVHIIVADYDSRDECSEWVNSYSPVLIELDDEDTVEVLKIAGVEM